MKKSYYYLLLLLTCLCSSKQVSFAQTISGIINQYTRVTALSGNTITVSSGSGFNVGDLALIIQMDGNPLTAGGVNAGNYEFTFVNTIAGNTMTLPPLSRNYSPATNKVQLIKVPNYTDVTVSSDVTCQSYNSQNGTGGVVVMYVCGTLTLEANIDVSAKGFRGANTHEMAAPPPTVNDVISHGEGISPFFTTAVAGGPNSPLGGVGGGGGMTYTSNSPDMMGFGGGGGGGVGGGGGGGGMYGGGGIAGKGGTPLGINASIAGQNGDNATGTGYFNASNKVFMGGGGGYEAHKVPYGNGGNGGGIVILVANEIVSNGHQINADGGNSHHNCNEYNDSDHFGGGGGGQILLHSPIMTGNLLLTAKGGNSNSCLGEYGAGGGGGGIWASALLPANVSTNVAGGLSPNLPASTVGYQQKGGNGLVIMSDLDLVIPGACSCPPTNCDDGLCFTVDSVNPLSCDCMHIPAVFNCNDNDCATIDSVDPTTCECTHTPSPFVCDDNNCMTTDVVNPNNCSCTHVPIEIPDCDDENCATTDSFNQNNCQCEHTPIDINCDDGLCSTQDSLDPTTCECLHVPIEIPDCNDNNCNTADVFNQTTCQCENNPISPTACDDGLCSTADTYNSNSCQCEHTPIAPPDCDDQNCNTNDSYNEQTCACLHETIAPPDCSDADPQTIDIYNEDDCTCEHLFQTSTLIPNAFSPNGDDINDIFRVFTNEPNLTDFNLEVYNRWGQKVFASQNLNEGWNGKWKGIDQEMGVYVYQLRYSSPINGNRLLHGNVTLVR